MNTPLLETVKQEKNKNSAFLMPPLNRFLVPRPMPPYWAPLDRSEDERTGPVLSGLGPVFRSLALPEAASSLRAFFQKTPDTQSPSELRQARLLAKKHDAEVKRKDALERWDPKRDSDTKTPDPFRTLFVGRLSYETTEKTLKREFGRYGRIESIKLVADRETGKSRGYAFIEFQRERDLKEAYLDADGMKVDSRRIVVDVERGRTVKSWRPRRLGGGMGGTRIGAKEENQKDSGRDPRLNVNVLSKKRGHSSRSRSPVPKYPQRVDAPRDGHRERESHSSSARYGDRHYSDSHRESERDRGYHRVPPPYHDRDRERERRR